MKRIKVIGLVTIFLLIMGLTVFAIDCGQYTPYTYPGFQPADPIQIEPIQIDPNNMSSDYYATMGDAIGEYQYKVNNNLSINNRAGLIEVPANEIFTTLTKQSHGFKQFKPTLYDEQDFFIHYPYEVCPNIDNGHWEDVDGESVWINNFVGPGKGLPSIQSCYETITGVENAVKIPCEAIYGVTWPEYNPVISGDFATRNENGELDWKNYAPSEENGITAIGKIDLVKPYESYNLRDNLINNCLSTDDKGVCTFFGYNTTVNAALWKELLDKIDAMESGEARKDSIGIQRVETFSFNDGTTQTRVFNFPISELTNCYHIAGTGKYNFVFDEFNPEQGVSGYPNDSVNKSKGLIDTANQVKNYLVGDYDQFGYWSWIGGVDPFKKKLDDFTFNAVLGKVNSCGKPNIEWRQTLTANSNESTKMKITGNLIELSAKYTQGGWGPAGNPISFVMPTDFVSHGIGHAMAGLSDSYEVNDSIFDRVSNAGVVQKNCVANNSTAFLFTPPSTGIATTFGYPVEECAGGRVAASCSNAMGFSSDGKFNNIEAGYLLQAYKGGNIAQNIYDASPPAAEMDTIRDPQITATNAFAESLKTNAFDKINFANESSSTGLPQEPVVKGASFVATSTNTSTCSSSFNTKTLSTFSPTVGWDPSLSTKDSVVTGYRIFWGNNHFIQYYSWIKPIDYIGSAEVDANTLRYTVNNLDPSLPWYFRITAAFYILPHSNIIDTEYSSEVFIQVGNPPSVNSRELTLKGIGPSPNPREAGSKALYLLFKYQQPITDPSSNYLQRQAMTGADKNWYDVPIDRIFTSDINPPAGYRINNFGLIPRPELNDSLYRIRTDIGSVSAAPTK